MSIDLTPIGGPLPGTAAPARGPRAAAPAAAFPQVDAFTPTAVDPTLPETIPHELATQISAAARTAADLHARGRELRFEPDPASGRVRVEVRDLDGNVLRQLPLTEALDVATGAPLRD